MGPIIGACWIIFLLYWAVSAPFVKKTAERLSWKGILLNRVPVVLGAILLFQFDPHPPLHIRIVPRSLNRFDIANLLALIGLFGAIWSRRTIGRNWSGDVVFKEGHEIIEKGPYQWVRHPIYTSILLMALGTAVALGHIDAFFGFLLICMGFLIKLQQEETLLIKHFPVEYPEYMTRVKKLIPFIY